MIKKIILLILAISVSASAYPPEDTDFTWTSETFATSVSALPDGEGYWDGDTDASSVGIAYLTNGGADLHFAYLLANGTWRDSVIETGTSNQEGLSVEWMGGDTWGAVYRQNNDFFGAVSTDGGANWTSGVVIESSVLNYGSSDVWILGVNQTAWSVYLDGNGVYDTNNTGGNWTNPFGPCYDQGPVTGQEWPKLYSRYGKFDIEADADAQNGDCATGTQDFTERICTFTDCPFGIDDVHYMSGLNMLYKAAGNTRPIFYLDGSTVAPVSPDVTWGTQLTTTADGFTRIRSCHQFIQNMACAIWGSGATEDLDVFFSTNGGSSWEYTDPVVNTDDGITVVGPGAIYLFVEEGGIGVVYIATQGTPTTTTAPSIFDDDSVFWGGNKTNMADGFQVTERGLEVVAALAIILFAMALGASFIGPFGAIAGSIASILFVSMVGWLPGWVGFLMFAVIVVAVLVLRGPGGD